MKFNFDSLPQELGFTNYKKTIENNNFSINDLKEFLIHNELRYIAKWNIINKLLEQKGFGISEFYIEEGGSNDVAIDLVFLNSEIERRYDLYMKDYVEKELKFSRFWYDTANN